MKKLLATLGIATSLGTGGVVVGDAVVNPYEDKNTHYELPIRAEIAQGERVEIAKNRAEMTLRGWNDEYAIKITPQIPTAETRLGATRRDFEVVPDRSLFSRKIEYRQDNVTAFIEPRSEDEFDIDFTLESEPATNVFEYIIEGAEDFDFFYQPELTQEEIAEGAERPENVVGSYAVYHKTKANHRIGSTNYATGKAFHIYRPKAIDANGNEVWATLNYENGKLTVTVDEKWLSEATYPVVVDPTFGYTSTGASTVSKTTNWMYCLHTSVSEGGAVNSISMYLVSGGFPIDNTKGVLVEDTNDTIVTNGVTDGFSYSSPTPQWYTDLFATDPSITAQTYMVCYITPDVSSGSLYYDTVADAGWLDTTNNGTAPTNPDDGANSDMRFSFYATYTAAAADPENPENSLRDGSVFIRDGGMIIRN